MNGNKNDHRLIPVTNWDKYHEWPTTGGLRHLIAHVARNGFEQCLVRVGKRILIDETAFFEWCRHNKNKGDNNNE